MQIDEDGAVNYEIFKEEIEDLQVNNMLKADLLEAVDMCKDFSTCMPMEGSKHPLMEKLGSAVTFMKCCSMKKVRGFFGLQLSAISLCRIM